MNLPLTLTLSPHAGRGDVPGGTWGEGGPAVPSPRLRGEGGGSRMRGRQERRITRSRRRRGS
ncbi:hypothetical protein EHS39_07015 [Ensifer sp. MPMI2T]|nr:hypothetical protein EHS39_07015 [Ensifer sp. MPMI2T]